VERDAAVDPAGSQRAGVPHLRPAAHQRPGARRVSALLLQAGVQPERLRHTHTQIHHCSRDPMCSG